MQNGLEEAEHRSVASVLLPLTYTLKVIICLSWVNGYAETYALGIRRSQMELVG